MLFSLPNTFPHYKQYDSMDCGPTCLKIIAKYYNKIYSINYLRETCRISREGVSLLNLSEAAEKIGFRSLGLRINFEQLESEVTLPCIVLWKQKHFIIIYKVTKNNVFVSDPAKGLIKYTKQEFFKGWSNGEKDGIALLLEPTSDFENNNSNQEGGINFKSFFFYFTQYKKLFFQLGLGLVIGSVIQLILPFLTQTIVDVGISSNDMQLIYLVLIGQLMLFLGGTIIDFIRNWILLHISSRVNISLLTDFLIKLMKLPASFFDTKMIGDIMQRMADHNRIESFLSSYTINIILNLFNLIIFSVIITLYSGKIFLVFLCGGLLYFFWILLFMRAKKDLDYKKFDIDSLNQSKKIQLINGMHEIKLNNCENIKRWEWEHIQINLFKINISSLKINQLQQGGGIFIDQLKNIIITFLSAQAVINGQLSLGGMMAIQYIIGQLNTPLQQFIQFIQVFQEAKISAERINEIHQMEDEEPKDKESICSLPQSKDVIIEGLTYRYPGSDKAILKNLDLFIPEGKVTAIVGNSGSGKTTLLKLLLRLMEPQEGEIKIGNMSLKNISHKYWRSQCGAVLQDGFIFSDTVAKNIALSDEKIDLDRLINAAMVANIHEFIESLPLGYKTRIGAEGNGISTGQKQRILIARTVYKNPKIIFFDEATNALDSNNEKVIIENLNKFFSEKTVVIVAHRLSTVKNADQIIVMNNGQISEVGSHNELSSSNGHYFHLIKNQLELGN